MTKKEKEVFELRRQIFINGYLGGNAHLASSFSCIEILYTLFLDGVLRLNPNNPDWNERDRFILSKGHAGLALYSVMWKAGYLTEADFYSYLTINGKIGGEPAMRDIKGIEASTGSLGHGLSIGVGMALAQKMDHLDAKTYVLIGDGECEEGSIWEAAMSAAALKLDNLIAILDCNELQKMDSINHIIGLNNWNEKWKSFGWNVIETDGHDLEQLKEAFWVQKKGMPTLVIAHTIKGKGVSIMENNPNWHFKLPNKKEKNIFMKELEISEEDFDAKRVYKQADGACTAR